VQAANGVIVHDTLVYVQNYGDSRTLTAYHRKMIPMFAVKCFTNQANSGRGCRYWVVRKACLMWALNSAAGM
jgi:hypothetical protein